MIGRSTKMRIGKCLLSGVLTAAMLCGSLFYTGTQNAGKGLLQVYAADNVALGKPVTVSEQDADSPNCLGSMVVDGIIGDTDNTTGRWSGGVLKAGVANNADQWVTIDLKAADTSVESIKIHFYKLVWSRNYTIQTSDSGNAESWEDVVQMTVTEEQRAGTVQNPTDTIAGSQAGSLKRYVRFFFPAGSLNSSAGGNRISIREIEIMGTQTGVLEEINSASEALNKIPGGITVGEHDSELSIPAVSDRYDIKVYGSEVDRLVDESEEANGAVSPYRIGDRSFNVILQATNKDDASDTAKKNVTVTVQDNTADYPELFPAVKNANPMPDVLPTIQEWYGYEGAFRLTEDSKIIVNDSANVGLSEVAEEMKKDIREICGLTLKIEAGTEKSAGNIYLQSLKTDTYGTGEEGYFLINGDNGIEIYSTAKTGVLYGTVTVEQILYQDASHAIVPKGVIRDYPLYELRGMMFDVARIPTRMQFLQDYTKILKWYKLNTMQVHLNDTQWSEPVAQSGDPKQYDKVEASHRLESELFPSLAKQPAKFEMDEVSSNGTIKYKGDYEGRYDYYYTHIGATDKDGNRTDLYYTKDEYRALEAAAGSRGIQLIPELDTPGHSTPYNKYVYNHQEEVITSLDQYGYLDKEDYFDADGSQKKNFYIHNEENFELMSIKESSENTRNAKIFMTALFDEYLGGIDGIDAVFTADTIHAGVDEYWKTDSESQTGFKNYLNYMYDLIGKSDSKAEYGKQETGYQKDVIVWGSFKKFPCSAEVSKNIILQNWAMADEDPIARMNEGFSIINIPQPYLYTTPGRYHKDMINETFIYYNWDPAKFSNNVSADKGEPHLKGGMAALWGDTNRTGITEADLNERYLRLAAMLGEKNWGGRKSKDTFLEYEQTFDRLREGPGTQIAYQIESKTNLVLDYNFENLSKDKAVIYDASGNGYNGTVKNGIVEEKDNEAMLKFNQNTTIETPLTSISYPYTVSFDIYLENAAANTKESALFSGYDGRLQAAGLNGELGLNRSHYTQSFGYSIEENQKHQITIVGTWQATKLYVDGVFQKILYAQASDPDHGGALVQHPAWTDKDNNFRTTFVFPLSVIGENFIGYLGNIRAYNKALSVEELAAENGAAALETDLARNRLAYADNGDSSYEADTLRLFPAWKATDGDGHVTGAEGISVSYESRWYSSNQNNDFLMIDLGQERKISKAVIDWEANRYADSYNIEVSSDGRTWTTVKEVTGNTSAWTTNTFDETTARYVKMQGVQRKSGAQEYAIYEMKVYGSVDKTALAAKCQETEKLSALSGVDWETEGAKQYLFESLVSAKAVCADVMAGQEEVDAAEGALEKAVADWNFGITELLYDCESILQDKDSYTQESWKKFYDAYEALKNAGEEDDLESLKAALETAKSELHGIISDSQKEEMKAALAEADKLRSKKDEYDEVSWARFETAYTAAVNAGENVSSQKYDELIQNLKSAIRLLVKKEVQLAAPAVAAVKSQKTNVSITWNAVANASGYQLYRKTGSAIVKVGDIVTGTTAYDENPLGGKSMSYYVIALAGGKAGYKDSAAGAAKSITLPNAAKKVTASQVKGKKAVSLKWKSVKGASSYLIYRAEGKGSFKKVGQVKKKLTYQDRKKLKKGKTYSYKVVAVVKKQYSPMKAAKKAVKIK